MVDINRGHGWWIHLVVAFKELSCKTEVPPPNAWVFKLSKFLMYLFGTNLPWHWWKHLLSLDESMFLTVRSIAIWYCGLSIHWLFFELLKLFLVFIKFVLQLWKFILMAVDYLTSIGWIPPTQNFMINWVDISLLQVLLESERFLFTIICIDCTMILHLMNLLLLNHMLIVLMLMMLLCVWILDRLLPNEYVLSIVGGNYLIIIVLVYSDLIWRILRQFLIVCK